MSDIILRIVPKEDIGELKTEKIKSELLNNEVISDSIEHWGKPAFKSGSRLNNYIELEFEDKGNYIGNLVIQISNEDYGVIMGSEDYDTINRKNCILIYNGDGSIISWTPLCQLLEKITGDEYFGEWEVL
ncbi:hypothetical protein [Portibacter marinus]|uniref:hypothetical protein n=1 Tax=Portibacter marinus TaxID=2898660 RepID=UPI001F189746|nr:hypothetical protein [Portibacter marinus]